MHPAALASPFFQAFGLAERIEWIHPEISYVHPLDGGRAGVAWRDIERTAAGLGVDGQAWLSLLRPLSMHIDGVVDFTGTQMLRVPREPLTAVRYALRMLDQGTPLSRRTFRTDEAAGLLSRTPTPRSPPSRALRPGSCSQHRRTPAGGRIRAGARSRSPTR